MAALRAAAGADRLSSLMAPRTAPAKPTLTPRPGTLTPALDGEIQDLAFIVHGASEAIAIPLDDNYHFVEVQAIAGLREGTTQGCGDDRSNGFVTNWGAPVELIRLSWDTSESDTMRRQKGPAVAGPCKSLIFGCGGAQPLLCNFLGHGPASRIPFLKTLKSWAHNHLNLLFDAPALAEKYFDTPELRDRAKIVAREMCRLRSGSTAEIARCARLGERDILSPGVEEYVASFVTPQAV